MKTFVSILLGLVMLAGCSRHSSQPVEVKYETITLTWLSDTAIEPNHSLVIRTVTATATNLDATDVSTLDQAANMLGQYGWKLVSTETKGNWDTWHMQRQDRGDGKQFYLLPESAAKLNELSSHPQK